MISIATEGVTSLNTHAIVIAEDVAVRVKAGKFGEVIGRFQRNNGAELEVVDEGVAVVRAVQVPLSTKRWPTLSEEMRTFRPKVFAVLRNQHKAGIRAIINTLRPRVAHAGAEMIAHALVEIDQQTIP